MARLPCNGISVRLEDDGHFILCHEKFTTVDYLLRQEVSLYFLDDTQAFFVEIDEHLDIHNTERFPFFYMAQQDYCRRVIVVPLFTLLKISDRIGSPKCDLTFLLHSARCGSTAVTQAINSVPGWKVMSESCFIHKHLYQMEHRQGVKMNEYVVSKRFFDVGEAALRFMFKDCTADNKVLYKAFGLLDYCLIPLLSERFSGHKIITMHRDGPGTCMSHYQAFRDTAAYEFMAFALKHPPVNVVFSRIVSRVMFVVTSGMEDEFSDLLEKTKCGDIFFYHYVRWVANTLQYLNYSPSAKNLQSIMFEDLISDSTATITKVL